MESFFYLDYKWCYIDITLSVKRQWSVNFKYMSTDKPGQGFPQTINRGLRNIQPTWVHEISFYQSKDLAEKYLCSEPRQSLP